MSCRSQQSSTRARPSACVRSALEVTLFLVSVSWVKSGVDSRCHVYGVHQDVLTQRPSPCVLCPAMPPARSASPRKPIGPHRRAHRLRQEARVPPRGCPLPSLCRPYPLSPHSRPVGGCRSLPWEQDPGKEKRPFWGHVSIRQARGQAGGRDFRNGRYELPPAQCWQPPLT